jgi:hypothetical protein
MHVRNKLGVSQENCKKYTSKKEIFFSFERPNLFAICNNTFSKWWEG